MVSQSIEFDDGNPRSDIWNAICDICDVVCEAVCDDTCDDICGGVCHYMDMVA